MFGLAQKLVIDRNKFCLLKNAIESFIFEMEAKQQRVADLLHTGTTTKNIVDITRCSESFIF